MTFSFQSTCTRKEVTLYGKSQLIPPTVSLLLFEGPRTRVVYPTKTCVELPEMHKNGLKIHTSLRRIA